jgi:hypothetical protein
MYSIASPTAVAISSAARAGSSWRPAMVRASSAT